MQSTALHLLNDGKSFEEGLIPLFVIIWELCKFVFPAYYIAIQMFFGNISLQKILLGSQTLAKIIYLRKSCQRENSIKIFYKNLIC